MTGTFIETTMFTRQWKDLGFLQNRIMGNPKTDDAVPGTGQCYSLFDNRGKSKSSRVCYDDFAIYETVYLMAGFNEILEANCNKTGLTQAMFALYMGVSIKRHYTAISFVLDS